MIESGVARDELVNEDAGPSVIAKDSVGQFRCDVKVAIRGKDEMLQVAKSCAHSLTVIRKEVVYVGPRGSVRQRILPFPLAECSLGTAFDPSSGKLSGTAVVVIDHVAHDFGVWRTIFSVSDTGILEFQSGTAFVGSELVFVDRTGKELGHLGKRAPYSTIRVSPDGKRLVTAMGDPKTDLWTFDLARGGAPTRLTFDESVNNPSWSPDGSLIYYNGFPNGSPGSYITLSSSSAVVYVKRADGSGPSKMIVQEPATDPKDRVRPAAMSPEIEPDGKNLLYIRREGSTGNTIVALPTSGLGKERLVVAPGSSQSNIIDFRLSPDGRWLAYTSNESGSLQVFLVPYPNSNASKWQVSSDGGQFVTWRGDSKEIYYFGTDNRLYAVPFDGIESTPRIGAPQALFAIPNTAFNGFYEPLPDGKRFLLNRIPEQASTPISILLNWPETLKK